MPDKEAMIRVVRYVVAVSVAGLCVALVLGDVGLIVAEVVILATLFGMIAWIKGSR